MTFNWHSLKYFRIKILEFLFILLHIGMELLALPLIFLLVVAVAFLEWHIVAQRLTISYRRWRRGD